MNNDQSFNDNINEAVLLALTEARKAVEENSYGVGGLLIHAPTGAIIHSMHNRVISNENGGKSRLQDPTAHGERQLVDWYFENKVAGQLPEPQDIIVITTLDPCCMCTGSILSAGFKAVVAALDNQAGIDYNYSHEFKPFEGRELQQIKTSFIYPESFTSLGSQTRESYGQLPRIYTLSKLSDDTIVECELAFNAGAKKAREIIGDVFDRSKLRDIKGVTPSHPIITELKKVYPQALTYRAQDPQNPDEGLANYLIEAAIADKRCGGDGDAVAFLDYFGNLLMCKPGQKNISPIRTAYMETIRAYQGVRYLLTKENNEALRYLSEPKYGTFVFVKGFDKGTQSFADLGAYGSTILGTFDNPSNLQYITPRIDQSSLEQYIQNMPPRYRDLIKPKRVTRTRLIYLVEKGISESL